MIVSLHSTKTLKHWEKGTIILRSPDLAMKVVEAWEEINKAPAAVEVENKVEWNEFADWAKKKGYKVERV